MNLTKAEALEIITAANPQYLASVDDSVLTVTTNSLLTAALALINQHKPLNKRGALTLQGGETEYPAPGDAVEIIGSDYGIEFLRNFTPMHPSYPKGIPSLYLIQGEAGAIIKLTNRVPGETQRFVGTLMGYDYKALYKIDDETPLGSNVPHTMQPVLEAASQVEAARRHINVAMHQKVGDGHRNKSVLNAQEAYNSLLAAFKQTTTGLG